MGGEAPAQQGPLPARLLPARIHAEFQLSEPPDFPFWFSPGQFTGHIILSKDATHIRDFRLFVPNHRWEPWPCPWPSLAPCCICHPTSRPQELRCRGLEAPSVPAPPSLPRATSLWRDLELTQEEAACGGLRGVIPSSDSMFQVLHGSGPPTLPGTQYSANRPSPELEPACQFLVSASASCLGSMRPWFQVCPESFLIASGHLVGLSDSV